MKVVAVISAMLISMIIGVVATYDYVIKNQEIYSTDSGYEVVIGGQIYEYD